MRVLVADDELEMAVVLQALLEREHFSVDTVYSGPRMVMKIVGASLAFAAFVCLLIGGWHDLTVGCCGMKKRLRQKFSSEYDDYNDEELYD